MNIKDTVEEYLTKGYAVGDVVAQLGLFVSDDVDLAISCDGPCVVLPGFFANDGNAEVEYPLAESGGKAARQYVEDGDWAESKETMWFNICTWQRGLMLDENGEVIEVECNKDTYIIDLDPKEPECCSEAGHNWCSPHSVVRGLHENPGVFAHGGGVIINEVCKHCGVYRRIDTWAQNPENGMQGLISTKYIDADEDSLEWIENNEDKRT